MKAVEDGVSGLFRFRQRYLGEQRELSERLVHSGHSPRIMVIGCCDPRVDPATITDCGPGGMLVVCNVARRVAAYATGVVTTASMRPWSGRCASLV